ncbi:MAG: hypothetical protein O9301_06410 [Leptospira sp.]|nr:hypothetical protein [Leptospira sp.]
MKNFRISFLGLVFLSTLCLCQTPTNPFKSLHGVYADPKPYSYGQTFGHRKFSFEKDRWTLDFTLSLDPLGKMPVFSFRTFGRYEVLSPSKVVPGAFEAIFYEDKKFVTLHTKQKELVDAFGFTPCALEVGIEKDISETGCSVWAPVSVCNEDHDLLALTETGGIRFGERPRDNNMCKSENRPTSLTPSVERAN